MRRAPGGGEHEHRDADDDLPREHEHADHEGHAALHEQRDRGRPGAGCGRRRGRAPSRGRCPGRSAARSSRRPSRRRRARPAARPPRAGRRRRAARRRPVRRAGATSEITFGSVTIRDPSRPACPDSYTDRPTRFDLRAARCTHHRRPGMAVPVTKDAASEQRNAATRPKSAGRRRSRPAAIPAAIASSSAAVERPDALGVVEARLERVHGDAVAGDLAGERLEERGETRHARRWRGSGPRSAGARRPT